MTECINCLEKITKLRPLIKCPHCSFEVCRTCFQKYSLSKSIPLCMGDGCGKRHSIEFFRDNVTMTFYNGEWKEAVKNKLFEEQEALLFNTQQFITHRGNLVRRLCANEKQIMDYKYKIVEYNNIKLLEVNPKGEFKSKRGLKDEPEEIKLARREIVFLENQNIHYNRELVQMDRNNNNWTPEHIIRYVEHKEDEKKNEKKEEVVSILMPCINSNCRGYVSNKYICELCNTNYCNKCRVIVKKDDEHKCNTDDLETVKYLRKETKPCPKCKIPISKIDGCDQMWCVGCHTSFSWSKGTILTGEIHNPEYYRYMRSVYGNVPRQRGDVPNDGCQQNTYNFINTKIYRILGRGRDNEGLIDSVFYLNRRNIHLNQVIRPRYTTETQAELHRLRILYLKNRINKEIFISKLSIINNKIIRYNEIVGVIDMIYMAIDDTIRNSLTSKEEILKIFKNVKIIEEIANEAYVKIANRWKCKPIKFRNLMLIDTDLDFIAPPNENFYRYNNEFDSDDDSDDDNDN